MPAHRKSSCPIASDIPSIFVTQHGRFPALTDPSVAVRVHAFLPIRTSESAVIRAYRYTSTPALSGILAGA
ncbi:hypothetical protein BMD20_28260 [Burkholderia multivorans]|nr:hypothetical protein BMD20_28260 [Burkholderia multivorans]PRD72591.1 hypothetical protein C6P75_20050 [Burkholderia multivorans]